MENKRELRELQTFRIVFFCFLVIMMEGFDIQAAGISAPKLAPALGLQPSQLGLFFSASAVGVLLFAAIGGVLADFFGRKPVIIAATFAFGFFCLLTPQCTDISALIVVRFLTGAGLGAAMPVVIAMTSDHSPTEQKKRYVGIVYCAIAFGGMLAAGVVATGILGNGWSQVFYVGGVVPILISIAMIFFLPVSKRVVAAPGAPEGNYWIDVLGWKKLPLTLSLWFATFLTLAVMYTMVMWMPSLMGARGISRADGAIIQMMYNLGSVVTSIATGYLLDKKLVYTVPTIGYIILAVSLAVLGLSPLDLLFASLLGFMIGIGTATGQTLLYAFAPLGYSAPVRNRAVGSTVAAGRVGTIVGPMVAGLLLAGGLTAGQVLVVMVPVAIAALVLCLLVVRFTAGVTAGAGTAPVAISAKHAHA
jgi:AAHS family 3-hydroxyphenylpropionic acid transporter